MVLDDHGLSVRKAAALTRFAAADFLRIFLNVVMNPFPDARNFVPYVVGTGDAVRSNDQGMVASLNRCNGFVEYSCGAGLLPGPLHCTTCFL